MAADLMFASDSTCCKCRVPGKSVQLHHIDEDPSHSVAENLAVLCLQCHDETQISGGFGRKLNAPLVIRYRDEWQRRVLDRRDAADRAAVERMAGEAADTAPRPPLAVETLKYSEERAVMIRVYLETLPQRRAELKRRVEAEWDSGVTARVVQGSYDYVDGLEGILVALAGFYPNGSFDGDPRRFFADAVAQTFKWHRAHIEPFGPGTGGPCQRL
jgi:hypothetical protein